MQLTMQLLIQRFRQLPSMRFLSPASEAEMDGWEENTSLSLPKEYRQWLRFSDGGELFIPGIQLYGVAHKPTLDFCNSGERRTGLPTDLTIIGTFGFGDLLCFLRDTETIVQWDHESWKEYMRWDTFYSFLFDAQEMLDEKGVQ